MAAAEAQATCQICFDDVQVSSLITKFCGAKCTGEVCASCLKTHVRTALEVSYTGALPRVKCPICLVPVNRERWSQRLSENDPERAELRREYRRLCLTACRFGVPCCHKGNYIHMPAYYTTQLTDKYALHAVPVANADALVIPDKDRKQRFLRDLRRIGKRFCRHDPDVSAGDVVRFLEDSFPDFDAKHDVYSLTNLLQIAYQLLATRIRDEERRARLVLAFHRRHPHMLTRCCGSLMCFNCKRRIATPEPLAKVECVCERDEDKDGQAVDISDPSCMLECRYCRVMLVKVDGCDSVVCPCGVTICWIRELQVLDHGRRRLYPVDVFDTTTYECWGRHKHRLHRMLKTHNAMFKRERVRIQLRIVARQEVGSERGFCETLRRHVLRRQFAFRLRNEWMPALRVKLAILRCPTLADHFVRFVWRRRFNAVVSEVRDGYKERSGAMREQRQRSLLRRLYLSAVGSHGGVELTRR